VRIMKTNKGRSGLEASAISKTSGGDSRRG
jgi:hypothetical protein